MRESFREWYKPSDDELRDLWRDAFIVLDTNALLDLYKYPEAALNEFLGVLKALRERLWMPYQVGLEFHKNRENAMPESRASLDRVLKEIESLRNSVDRLNIPVHHPVLDVDGAERARLEVQASLEALVELIVTARDAIPIVSAADILNDDPLLLEVNSLYEGRTGQRFTPQELSEATKEAESRYEREIPPGFKDRDKEESRRYNDYFIWKQTLVHARSAGEGGQPRPCIFVTNERKPDWWRRKGEEVLAPRTELIREFIDSVGRNFYMYLPDRFLADANVYLLSNVPTETIEEVRRVSEGSPVESRLRWQRMVLPKLPVRVSTLSRLYDSVAQGTLAKVEDLNAAIAALGEEFRSPYVAQPLFFSLINETYGPVRVEVDLRKKLRDRSIYEIRSASSLEAFVEVAHVAWLAQALYRIREEEFGDDQLLTALFGEDYPPDAAPLLRRARSAMEKDRAFREGD